MGHVPRAVIVETPPAASRSSAIDGEPRSNDRLNVPVLSAQRGSLPEVLAGSLGRLHPAVVFILVMLAGLAVIAALSIGLGLLVTRVVEPAWGIGAANERVNEWLAVHRSATRTHGSLLGSIIAGGVVLPIVVACCAIAFAGLRRWRIAAFFVFALAVESAAYRATTLVVRSHRPRVPRLEQLPVNASYPSGHTAAAIAVYGGAALLLTSRVANRLVRIFAWTLALAVVTFVASARMYRGMHHPLDVAGGVFVGVAALAVVAFACRTADAAADSRDRVHASLGARA
jgi:membrane-associated phospholipid phosphatase